MKLIIYVVNCSLLESPSTSNDDEIDTGVYKINNFGTCNKTLNERKKKYAIGQHAI